MNYSPVRLITNTAPDLCALARYPRARSTSQKRNEGDARVLEVEKWKNEGSKGREERDREGGVRGVACVGIEESVASQAHGMVKI